MHTQTTILGVKSLFLTVQGPASSASNCSNCQLFERFLPFPSSFSGLSLPPFLAPLSNSNEQTPPRCLAKHRGTGGTLQPPVHTTLAPDDATSGASPPIQSTHSAFLFLWTTDSSPPRRRQRHDTPPPAHGARRTLCSSLLHPPSFRASITHDCRDFTQQCSFVSVAWVHSDSMNDQINLYKNTLNKCIDGDN